MNAIYIPRDVQSLRRGAALMRFAPAKTPSHRLLLMPACLRERARSLAATATCCQLRLDGVDRLMRLRAMRPQGSQQEPDVSHLRDAEEPFQRYGRDPRVGAGERTVRVAEEGLESNSRRKPAC